MPAVILHPGHGFALGYCLGKVSDWCRKRGVAPVSITYEFQTSPTICVQFRLNTDAEAFAEAFFGDRTTDCPDLRFTF